MTSGLKYGGDYVHWNRWTEIPALDHVAPMRAEELDLRNGRHTFGDHLEIKVMR